MRRIFPLSGFAVVGGLVLMTFATQRGVAPGEQPALHAPIPLLLVTPTRELVKSF
ncbi:MAG: hypothetical protein JWN18_649 [Parcubacteria group bacterium]|nr:hypothetical protein [Parcubacteria group bacterium]